MVPSLRMWLNAQQIMQSQWTCDARQISRRPTIQIAHFPFPFFQRFATVGRRKCSRPETDAMSCHSSNEATGASEMPQFAVSPSQKCDYPRKDFEAPWNHFWASTRGLWAGKAIRPHLHGHSSSLRGTGLAHVPYFYSIGKLTTRSDFHRTEIWPDNSASRGHGIWHEGVPTHGRPWMAAINLWQFYPVSLIGLPMPLFQSHGKPNSPILLRDLGDRPDKIASNGVCSDYENSSSDCHLHEWNLVARWYQGNFFPILQTSLLRAAESVLPNRVNFC